MDYVIPLNGWAASERKVFRWEAGIEFFQQFDNQEFLGAGIVIDAVAVRKDGSIDTDLGIRGSVKVRCDRCLGELELPVEVQTPLSIVLGAEVASPAAEGVSVPALAEGPRGRGVRPRHGQVPGSGSE